MAGLFRVAWFEERWCCQIRLYNLNWEPHTAANPKRQKKENEEEKEAVREKCQVLSPEKLRMVFMQ